MDAQLKAKWVEALRSGEYKQGQNYLNAHGAFCCLGVLCDISGDGHWDEDAAGWPEILQYTVNGCANRACLPSPIANKYGLHNPGPLIGMNDSGKSFAEIADYIEANL